METGLYLTFFESGEPFERELPPVGPLDHVVVRQRQLLADRAVAHQPPEASVDIARWLEAELELQRALGEEPGGTKRSEIRVTARDGVYVRFVVFGDPREEDLMPELGPFAVVVVGTRELEADGQVLATRQPSEPSAWDITSAAGDAFGGLHKPDIAFRSAATSYHDSIAGPPARGRAGDEPLFTPAPREEVYTPPITSRAYAEEPPALRPRDLELIERMERERVEEALRASIQDEKRAAREAEERAPQDTEDATPVAVVRSRRTGIRGLVWRLLFAIVGLLILGALAYGLIRGGG